MGYMGAMWEGPLVLLSLLFLEGEAGMGIVTVRHKYHKCGEEVEKCEM
jgi:hypothetical protein